MLFSSRPCVRAYVHELRQQNRYRPHVLLTDEMTANGEDEKTHTSTDTHTHRQRHALETKNWKRVAGVRIAHHAHANNTIEPNAKLVI